MKKISLRFGVLMAVVFSTSQLLAAEDPVTSSMALPEQAEPLASWDRLSAFVGAYPIPVISGGVGAALEYRVTDRLSLWADTVRSQTTGVGDSFWQLDSYVKAVTTGQSYGLRLYSGEKESSSWFVGTGYKNAVVETGASPSLLSANASKRDVQDGAYATLGYSLKGLKSTSTQWLVDFGLSYAPGKLIKAKYVPTQTGLFGATAARLDTEVGYGFFPEARVGLRF